MFMVPRLSVIYVSGRQVFPKAEPTCVQPQDDHLKRSFFLSLSFSLSLSLSLPIVFFFGACLIRPQGEGLPSVTAVAFSSDGSSLFSASTGKEVVEWNLETGAVARKLK